jgi:hypothetical protein
MAPFPTMSAMCRRISPRSGASPPADFTGGATLALVVPVRTFAFFMLRMWPRYSTPKKKARSHARPPTLFFLNL